MTRTAEQELSAEYQRAVGEFVGREVIYCVSTLICNLSNNADAGCLDYYDDILSICVSDDWETPAWDEGWRETTNHDNFPCFYHAETDNTDYSSGWQELCEEHDIEPQQREAYEHYIVSNFLAGQLGARGEMVADDIHGLTIWGRTCTGQSILLDSVICNIYDATQK